MKSVVIQTHIASMPSIGDFIDVGGEGHTGQAEVLNVVDNNFGTHQVYVRIRFLIPFANEHYLGASNGGSHPAYFDTDVEVNDTTPDSRIDAVLLGI